MNNHFAIFRASHSSVWLLFCLLIFVPGCSECVITIDNKVAATRHVQNYVQAKKTALMEFDINPDRVATAATFNRFSGERPPKGDYFILDNGPDEYFDKTPQGSGFWQFAYGFVLGFEGSCREVLVVTGDMDICGHFDHVSFARKRIAEAIGGCASQ